MGQYLRSKNININKELKINQPLFLLFEKCFTLLGSDYKSDNMSIEKLKDMVLIIDVDTEYSYCKEYDCILPIINIFINIVNSNIGVYYDQAEVFGVYNKDIQEKSKEYNQSLYPKWLLNGLKKYNLTKDGKSVGKRSHLITSELESYKVFLSKNSTMIQLDQYDMFKDLPEAYKFALEKSENDIKIDGRPLPTTFLNAVASHIRDNEYSEKKLNVFIDILENIFKSDYENLKSALSYTIIERIVDHRDNLKYKYIIDNAHEQTIIWVYGDMNGHLVDLSNRIELYIIKAKIPILTKFKFKPKFNENDELKSAFVKCNGIEFIGKGIDNITQDYIKLYNPSDQALANLKEFLSAKYRLVIAQQTLESDDISIVDDDLDFLRRNKLINKVQFLHCLNNKIIDVPIGYTGSMSKESIHKVVHDKKTRNRFLKKKDSFGYTHRLGLYMVLIALLIKVPITLIILGEDGNLKPISIVDYYLFANVLYSLIAGIDLIRNRQKNAENIYIINIVLGFGISPIAIASLIGLKRLNK